MAEEFEVVKDENGQLVKRAKGKKEVTMGAQSFFVDEDAGYNSKLQIDGELFCIREMTTMQYRAYQKREKAVTQMERDIAKQRNALQRDQKNYAASLQKEGVEPNDGTEADLLKRSDELEEAADKFVTELAQLHEDVVVKHVAAWSFDRECSDDNKKLLSPSIKLRLAESIVRKSCIGKSDADFLGKR